jgi:hypothetical protein
MFYAREAGIFGDTEIATGLYGTSAVPARQRACLQTGQSCRAALARDAFFAGVERKPDLGKCTAISVAGSLAGNGMVCP